MSNKKDPICGECLGPYSVDCQTVIFCEKHFGKCFKCGHCQPELDDNQLQVCSHCGRHENPENMFYDVQCDTYFCVHQFLKKKLTDPMTLPCDLHLIPLNQFCMFMTQACFHCGRKTTSKGQVTDYGVFMCQICQKKYLNQHSNKVTGKIKKSQENQGKKSSELEEGQFYDYTDQKIIKNSIDLPSTKNLVTDTEKPKETAGKEDDKNYQEILDTHKKQIIIEKHKKEELAKKLIEAERTIEMLLQEAQNIRESRNSLTDMTSLLKTLIDDGYDDCVHCLQKFDAEDSKMPFQICLNQHMICRVCFEFYKTRNYKECPICRVIFEYDTVQPCRLQAKLVKIRNVLQKGLVGSQKDKVVMEVQEEKVEKVGGDQDKQDNNQGGKQKKQLLGPGKRNYFGNQAMESAESLGIEIKGLKKVKLSCKKDDPFQLEYKPREEKPVRKRGRRPTRSTTK